MSCITFDDTYLIMLLFLALCLAFLRYLAFALIKYLISFTNNNIKNIIMINHLFSTTIITNNSCIIIERIMTKGLPSSISKRNHQLDTTESSSSSSFTIAFNALLSAISLPGVSLVVLVVGLINVHYEGLCIHQATCLLHQ